MVEVFPDVMWSLRENMESGFAALLVMAARHDSVYNTRSAARVRCSQRRCRVKADGRDGDNSQTPLVSVLNLKGLLVSRESSVSCVLSRALLSTRACPGIAVVTKPSGTDLQGL